MYPNGYFPESYYPSSYYPRDITPTTPVGPLIGPGVVWRKKRAPAQPKMIKEYGQGVEYAHASTSISPPSPTFTSLLEEDAKLRSQDDEATLILMMMHLASME